VLEISIDGGAYTDILSAGGQFVEGGYTFTLQTTANGNTSALANRPAWTGNSGGFVTTKVKLPASTAGKNVKFRWYSAADSATTPTGNGWYIDNVQIVQGYQCTASNCAADLGVTQTAAPAAVTTGSDLTFNITVTNDGPARATGVTVSDSLPAGTSFVSAAAPSGWDAATPNVGDGGPVYFTKSSLAAGESASFTLVVRADCGVPTGTNISNTVTVAGTRPDANNLNNSSTASATAQDPAPVINAPADITQPADAGQPNAVVNYTATTTDNCGNVNLASSHPSGAAFPIGTTTVTLTATDATGNVTTKTFKVTVNDAQAPVISDESLSRTVLPVPNHKMEDVSVNYAVSDNSGVVTTTLSVASNEPVNGTGDGDTGPDWEVVNNRLVRLRAERAGTGTGRVYTVTIRATDATGNTTTRTLTVLVPKG